MFGKKEKQAKVKTKTEQREDRDILSLKFQALSTAFSGAALGVGIVALLLDERPETGPIYYRSESMGMMRWRRPKPYQKTD